MGKKLRDAAYGVWEGNTENVTDYGCKRIGITKVWRKLYSVELLNLFFSPNAIRMMGRVCGAHVKREIPTKLWLGNLKGAHNFREMEMTEYYENLPEKNMV